MRTATLLVLMFLLAAPTRASTVIDLEAEKKAAEERARAAGNFDPNADLSGGRPVPGEMGGSKIPYGCIGQMNRPSLLGVAADMGAGLSPRTRGMETALSDNHPLRIALTEKNRAVKDLQEKEIADLQAVAGGGTSWEAMAQSYAEDIDIVQVRLVHEQDELARLQESIRALKIDDKPERRQWLMEQVGKQTAKITQSEQDLARYTKLLPKLQAGAATHKAAMKYAALAQTWALRDARSEAARCP